MCFCCWEYGTRIFNLCDESENGHDKAKTMTKTVVNKRGCLETSVFT